MKTIIAAAIFAASFAVNAAQVCSEGYIPGRGVVIACKNVPDAPRGEPLPKPPESPTRPTPAPSRPFKATQEVQAPAVVEIQAPDIRGQAYSGIAQAASLQMLMPSDGKSTLNLSGATFGGQSAIGITFAHRSGSLIFSGGFSAGSSGNGLVRVGAGFEF